MGGDSAFFLEDSAMKKSSFFSWRLFSFGYYVYDHLSHMEGVAAMGIIPLIPVFHQPYEDYCNRGYARAAGGLHKCSSTLEGLRDSL
jgi:hypothetical protein